MQHDRLSSSSEAAGKRVKRQHRVGILLGDRSNPFWIEMQRQYRGSAQELGLLVAHRWPSPRQDPSSQLRALRAMLREGFDAIVVNPMTGTNLVPGILEAADRGIPVLDVGMKTDPSALNQGLWNYIPVRTVDFYEQGLMAGKYIADKLKAEGGGKVAIIEGREDSAQSMGRSRGAADAFLANPTIHLVCRKPAFFDRSKAKALAGEILAGEPQLKAFFCANDTMALGVGEAVEEAGSIGAVLVVGVDLIEEARKAIRRGRITASVFFSPQEVARVVLGRAMDLLDGRRSALGCKVRSLLVDRDNLSAYPVRALSSRTMRERKEGGRETT